MIFDIIKSAIGIASDLIQGHREIRKAEQDRKLAMLENQARLLRDEQSNNSAWEMAQLADSDKLLRRICFFIFSTPFIYAMVDPIAVEEYFHTALSSIPDWYVKTYMGIVGAVWGISSLKNAIPQVVNFIRKN